MTRPPTRDNGRGAGIGGLRDGFVASQSAIPALPRSGRRRDYTGEAQRHWDSRTRVLGTAMHLDPTDPGGFYDQLVADLGGRDRATRFVYELACHVGLAA